MKEIVIVSGKGGTGKTSIAGCFAALARANTALHFSCGSERARQSLAASKKPVFIAGESEPLDQGIGKAGG